MSSSFCPESCPETCNRVSGLLRAFTRLPLLFVLWRIRARDATVCKRIGFIALSTLSQSSQVCMENVCGRLTVHGQGSSWTRC